MDKLKIDGNLKFGYSDLLKEIDLDHQFTLGDFFDAVANSEIRSDDLTGVVRCPCIFDILCESVEPCPIDEHDDALEYLSVSWAGELSTFQGHYQFSNSWHFSGTGVEGSYLEYSGDFISEATKKTIKAEERQSYGVGLTKTNQLRHLPVIVDTKITISDWDNLDPNDIFSKEYRPEIRLIDLLYTIFYELSFYESPATRGGVSGELDRRKKEYETGNMKLVPWEEGKKRIKANLEAYTKGIKDEEESSRNG